MRYNKDFNNSLQIGENLKKFRKACALSQQQVADAVGIERSSYTCYETGKSLPPIPTAVKLARVFGVSLDDLVSSSNDSFLQGKVADSQPDVYEVDSILPVENFQNLTKNEKELVIHFRLMKYEDMDYYLTKIIEAAAQNEQ